MKGKPFPMQPVSRGMNVRANALYMTRAIEAGHTDEARRLSGEILRDTIAIQRSLDNQRAA